ncbi:MAG TPA: hypothetical protein VFN38_06290 [Gemmatimonadaceae bacterium]|nr:hypothetical protein [Gemmatimonadaceae bacterium]
MSHLSAERLAALADASPATTDEAAHLASCAHCAEERDAHRRLAAMALDERSRLAPPLTDWSSLSAALRAEGLIDESAARRERATSPVSAPGAGRASSVRPLFSSRAGLRVAAALLLVAGGAAFGRASAGVRPVPGFAVAPTVAAGEGEGEGASQLAELPGRMLDTVRSAGASLVADTTATFRSTTDALVALAKAEQQYQLAAAFLLEHDSASGMSGARTRAIDDSSSVYRMRLAALDNVMAASREALYEAPHDPVINRYYLATLGAREATLRQLNTALPAGARLARY